MRFIFLSLIFILGATPVINGQTARAFEKAGDEAFEERDLGAALQYYADALELRPDKMELAYKYAEVARSFFAYEMALQYYQKVQNSEQAKQFPLTLFRIAEVYHGLGNYEEAKLAYQAYLKDADNEVFKKSAEEGVAASEWAIELTEHADDVKIQALNKRVNTPYSEFSPLLRGDTLYYSSLRYDMAEDEHDPPRKISKLLVSVNGAKGRPLRRRFNSDEKLTAHATFNENGDRIYFTICEYQKGLNIRCDLHYRDWDVKRKRWGKVRKLPESINQKGSTTTHPHYYYDASTKEKMLLFVSNRSGGKGGLDLWKVKITSDGSFGKPSNLSTLNTADNEITPFIHRPSNTLFFSSDGYTGLGGYDIFSAKWKEETPVVKHTGYPLNSSFNDMYFIIDADSTVAYLSSNREGAMYLDENNKSCCNDIFRAQILAPAAPASEDSTRMPDLVTVPIPPPAIDQLIEPEPKTQQEKVPTTLEDFLPLALYFDNDEPDRRTRRNTTRKSYLQTFEPYYDKKTAFLIQYTEGFSGTEKEEAEERIDDFFTDQVLKGKEHLGLFSDILLKRLQEGEQIEIFIKGFTSPRAKSDYNIHLGKRRISSLVNHFTTYADSVFVPYIKKGALKISERSFGETTAEQGINDDLDNRRLSIYSPEASRERRVEIVEIQRSEQ